MITGLHINSELSRSEEEIILNHVDILKSCFEGVIPCVECDKIGEIALISFGEESEPYVLNFKLENSDITVNVIDKDRKAIVDSYSDTFETEEELRNKAMEAGVAYDVILASRPEVEQKLESKAESDRRDDVVYNFKAIKSEVLDFTEKYDHDYNEEDTNFDADAMRVSSNIEMYLSDIKERCKGLLTESAEEPEELPVDQGEKKANEVSPKDTIEDEELAYALESAGELTLLQTLISKLNARAESEEDEINERVVSDVAIQLEELIEELETIVQE